MIKLLIADGQALVRGALIALLELEDDLDIVAECGRGDEVLELARTSGADVALLDIEMPGMNGIEVAQALHDSDIDCRSLIVTTFGRAGYLRRAMDAGADGFIVKDTPASELASAVRTICEGGRVVDPALAAESIAGGRNPLTQREREVLLAAESGATTTRIAGKLFLSPGTVRNHISSAMTKLEAHTRSEAIAKAREAGWL